MFPVTLYMHLTHIASPPLAATEIVYKEPNNATIAEYYQQFISSYSFQFVGHQVPFFKNPFGEHSLCTHLTKGSKSHS